MAVVNYAVAMTTATSVKQDPSSMSSAAYLTAVRIATLTGLNRNTVHRPMPLSPLL